MSHSNAPKQLFHTKAPPGSPPRRITTGPIPRLLLVRVICIVLSLFVVALSIYALMNLSLTLFGQTISGVIISGHQNSGEDATNEVDLYFTLKRRKHITHQDVPEPLFSHLGLQPNGSSHVEIATHIKILDLGLYVFPRIAGP